MSDRSLFSYWKVALGAAALLLGSGLVRAQLPAPLKPEHPRIFLDAQKVASLRALLPQQVAFPSKGSLQFTITPRRPSESEGGDLGVFDGYSDQRNHIFVRHIRSYDRLDIPTPTIGLQLAFQAVSLPSYIAVARLDLPVDQAVQLRIRWDVNQHQADYAINGSVFPLVWRVTNGVPLAWQPDGQLMSISGRAGENVSALKLTDELSGQVLADYPELDHELLRQWRNTQRDAEAYASILNTCAVATDPLSCGKPAVLTGPENTLSHPTRLQDIAQLLAFSHLITGQTQYRTAALNYASQLLATPLGEGGEFPMRGRVAAMGILYDWLYPVVTTTPLPEASESMYADALAHGIQNTILARNAAGAYLLGSYICGQQALKNVPLLDCASRPMIENWDPILHAQVPSIAPYYISGHHRGAVAAMALGLAAIGTEHPQVAPLLNLAYDHFDKGFYKARNWINQNGGTHLGWSYGASNPGPLELWRTALTWGDAPVAPPDYARHAFLFYLYGARGSTQAVFPAAGDNFVINWDDQVASMALYGAQYGNAHEAPAARWLYEQHVAPARGSGGLLDILLWSPGSKNAASPDALNLPLSRHFKVSGNVVMRDSWDYKSATLAEFHSASFTSENHQHFDQNSFSLFYKAPLLLDSGVYDFYGSDHWWNYYIRSVAHNTAIVTDPAETFSYAGKTYANDGGQWLAPSMARYPTLEQAQAGPNKLDGIVRFEAGVDYSYAVGDASKAYASTKLEREGGFVRQLVFLRQPEFWAKPVLITYDQIKVVNGKESLPKTILLHTAKEPLVASDGPQQAGVTNIALVNGRAPLLEIRNGGAMAFVETLIPLAPQMRKVGGIAPSGNSYRFAVRSPQSNVYTGYAPVNYGSGQTMTEVELDKVEDAGSWRVEISDTSPTKLARFLNVISVADDGSAAPPAATHLPADSTTEAIQLGATGMSLVLVLPKQPPQVKSHGLRVADPYATRYLVTGLIPDQYYSVSVTPVAGDPGPRVSFAPSGSMTPYRSSVNGVLSIERLPQPSQVH